MLSSHRVPLRLATVLMLCVTCPQVERVCEDAREGACPSDFVDAVLRDRDVTKRVHLNQFDMSLTQFAFSGLVVTFPERFGLHGNLDRELDAFCHVWAGLGYALGIEDRCVAA